MDITADDAGIEATFKIAGTIAGDDSLLEAAEGLRDGFSVGVMVDDWKNKDGVMSIKAAKLIEVSLVTDPAIDSARVADVAATETPTENSEATAEDKTTQEEKVSDITSEAPIATEAVEAAQSEPVAVSATQPIICLGFLLDDFWVCITDNYIGNCFHTYFKTFYTAKQLNPAFYRVVWSKSNFA